MIGSYDSVVLRINMIKIVNQSSADLEDLLEAGKSAFCS